MKNKVAFRLFLVLVLLSIFMPMPGGLCGMAAGKQGDKTMRIRTTFRLFVILALLFVLMQATAVSAHAWWLVWSGGW
jgi:hypothetical protein